MLKVLIINDDLTPMDFVVDLLERVFDKSLDEATKIMLETHHKGQAVCGIYQEARARDLLSQASALVERAGHPLKLSLADAETGQPV
jgi:ATP-dependent Clp protease adaptor protein ClpS